MPSSYSLTLLSQGLSSGPNYVVTYTTGSVYGPVLAGSPAYLPSVGSSAIVTISENTGSFSYLAFKLTSGTSGCELCNNEVIFTVTGSAPVVPTASICCAPEITNVAVTGSTANIYFTTQSGTCASCVAITAQTSSNGVDWGSNTTSGCTSPFVYNSGTGFPTGSYVDFRLQMTCSGSTSSSYSNIGSFITGSGGGGGTGSVCNTYWTVRNASCGFGTVNDVGINGYFMGNLSGPSTFPLTTTLYGTKDTPNGVNCTGSNTIQVNVTTNLPGTGNCGAVFIYINNNPAPSYTKFFTTEPVVQVSNVTIANGDNVEVMVACFSGPCP